MFACNEEELDRLVKAFLRGEGEAFGRMAFLVHRDILNIAFRYVGNAEDAKDVLQEVLLKIYQKLKLFKNTAKFTSWLYRMTINTSIDLLRKRKRRFNLGGRYKRDKEVDTSLREEADSRDKKHAVGEALAALPSRQRSVFILRHYQGLRIKEISKILGCSQSTTKTHLKRAIDNLRRNVGGSI